MREKVPLLSLQLQIFGDFGYIQFVVCFERCTWSFWSHDWSDKYKKQVQYIFHVFLFKIPNTEGCYVSIQFKFFISDIINPYKLSTFVLDPWLTGYKIAGSARIAHAGFFVAQG